MIDKSLQSPMVTINACFPRSGHRFLRQLVAKALGNDFRFCDYHPVGDGSNINKQQLDKANYVKAHDFEVLGPRILEAEFGEKRRFLIQVRHPLFSIASYYEFALKHGFVPQDTKSAWMAFLQSRLEYWKNFVDAWVIKNQEAHNFLLVTYEDLASSPLNELRKVLTFLQPSNNYSDSELLDVINQVPFYQYSNEEESEKQSLRRLTSFPYFDKKVFSKIEKELAGRYLAPVNIDTVFR